MSPRSSTWIDFERGDLIRLHVTKGKVVMKIHYEDGADETWVEDFNSPERNDISTHMTNAKKPESAHINFQRFYRRDGRQYTSLHERLARFGAAEAGRNEKKAIPSDSVL